ncbi:hypothetical protein LCGC14_2589440, partial [marine sediment metagenome]
LLMCVIVGLSPLEVDCDNQWLLIQEDGLSVATGDKGVAAYDTEKHPVSRYYPELGTEYDDLRWMAVANLKHDNCWNKVETSEPTNCKPLIWHEILHLICTCNWHEKLIKTFKEFSGIFGGM